MILCIDWGATLVKIVRSDGIREAVKSDEFLIEAHLDDVDEVRVTGIRSLSLPERIAGINVRKFDEFDSVAEAAGSGLAVNVGTGTSVVDTRKRKRVGGTGVGGGTIMGLCSLFAEGSFEEYEAMAGRGNRKNVDLLVGDICDSIGDLSGDVTASNLSKLSREKSAEDCIAGVFNMVGETIGTVACTSLRGTDLGHITFLGSVVRSDLLREILKGVCGLYGCDHAFSKDPQFAVAESLLAKNG